MPIPRRLDENSPQTILITGVSRGLGYNLARQFSERRQQVIGTVRSTAHDRIEPTIIKRIQLDLEIDQSIQSLSNQILVPLDVLINNAGISDARGLNRESPPFDALTPEHINSLLNVNLIAQLRVVQALLPNLRRGRSKIIVFISSELGSIGRNHTGGRYAYRMSKACVNMFARTLAADLEHEGFIVVAMDPGWVRTDMGGPDAPLSPERSAQQLIDVLFTLTAENNGSFLDLNGNNVAW